jgi:Copper transport outer membrane protein, MctB
VIDFRYHLVSIVAVFLALGLGLVLGSTALQPTVLSGLEKTSAAEKKQIDSLLSTKSQLQRQLNGNDHFAQDVAPLLLSHLLAGKWVVVVSAPTAPGEVTHGVLAALHRAGATVTGQVQLQAKFFDTSSSTQAELSTLTQRITPVSLALGTGSPQSQASQLLASELLTKNGVGDPAPGQHDSVSGTILNGLAAGGFLTVSGQPAVRATLAVVIPPASPPSADDSNPASQELVTLAQQFASVGQGTVMAGSVSGSASGSAVHALRDQGQVSHLSSVDNADTAIGQIVVVQALYEELHGVSGSYGTASSATSAAPSPAPSPAPTASASVQATAGDSTRATPQPTGSGTP